MIAQCYHPTMATLNIRNVPEDVVVALKRRAELKGVSLNSEVVEALSGAARHRSVDEVLASIDRIQDQFKVRVDFDELIERMRHDRDERDERTWRAATRPAGS